MNKRQKKKKDKFNLLKQRVLNSIMGQAIFQHNEYKIPMTYSNVRIFSRLCHGMFLDIYDNRFDKASRPRGLRNWE